MKITILQENLYNILKSTSSFIPSSPQLSILESFLIEGRKDGLYISATDLSLGIRKKTRAKVEKEGKVCIKAKSIISLISQLPAGKIELYTEKDILNIKARNTQATLNIYSADDYPNIKEIKKGEKTEKELFTKLAEEVAYAAAQDESRVVLTGIKIETTDGKQRAIATDGFRLSVKELDKTLFTKDSKGLIIPARLFVEVGRLISDDKEEIRIEKEEGTLILSWRDTIVNVQLIEGKFPAYESIIPEKFLTKAEFDKNEAERLIKTAAIFAREGTNIIRFKIEEEGIKISANSPQVGSSINTLQAKVDGQENKIAYNYRYLLDFLKSAKGEEITFEMTEPLKPGVFRVKGDSSYFHIIMPVRVHEENKEEEGND